MNIWEVAAAGFWLAALVEVAGFTWEAFTQTYQQFPTGASGGDGSIPGPGQPIPKTTPGTGQNSPLEPGAGIPSGPKVKAPPANLVQPIILATRARDSQHAITALLALTKWGNGPGAKMGWKGNQIQATGEKNIFSKHPIFTAITAIGPVIDWATTQPWWNDFRRLTNTTTVEQQ